jgi:Uma2 family endonuclease
MAVEPRSVTAEELFVMPDDGFRYELVEGELKKTVPVGSEHGYVALRFGRLLGNYVETSGLGRVYAAETGFNLASNPDTVRASDVAFVRRERVEVVGRVEGFWPGAPDLAVDVVSPGDTHAAVMGKAVAWLEAGCCMVLVADPEQDAVTVYRSREDVRILVSEAGDVIDGADVVPGWRLPVAEVFA